MGCAAYLPVQFFILNLIPAYLAKNVPWTKLFFCQAKFKEKIVVGEERLANKHRKKIIHMSKLVFLLLKG